MGLVDVYTSFTTTIKCNPDVTGKGNAKPISIDFTTNPCDLNVVYEHFAGCGSYTYEADQLGFILLQDTSDPMWALTLFLSGGKILFVSAVTIFLRFFFNCYQGGNGG